MNPPKAQRSLVLPALFALLTAASPVLADDWPQWRGPARDGLWRETGIVEKFESDRLAPKWKVPVSSGYSGPTVAQGRVYVTDRVTSPEEIERVLCFDANTGEQIWSKQYDCRYRDIDYTAGPRASVTVDDGRAYSLGAMGHLLCFDAADGTLIWRRNLNTEYKIRMPIWGIAASPLVEGDLLIVQIGGEDNACLVAFDKKTGLEQWRALPDRASYAAPIMIEQAGRRVLVCWTGDNVVGLNPESGAPYWQHAYKPHKMVLSIATPIVHRDRLFVTGFYDGALMLKLHSDRPAVQQVWRRRGADERHTDSLHSIISTPLMDGEFVYGVDSYGELRCLEAGTGDRVWEDLTATPKARWSNIHFVRNAGKVWMFNEQGELIISKLSPRGFHEISRAKLLEPTAAQINGARKVCWSHPAYANRHVFARSDEELVCASLEAK